MSDLTIANIIRQQIGSKALYMLGAKNLVGGENFLQFAIRGSRKVNHLVVALDPSDTYTIKALKITQHGLKIKEVSEENGIYCDMLHKSIERQTGLSTSL